MKQTYTTPSRPRVDPRYGDVLQAILSAVAAAVAVSPVISQSGRVGALLDFARLMMSMFVLAILNAVRLLRAQWMATMHWTIYRGIEEQLRASAALNRSNPHLRPERY